MITSTMTAEELLDEIRADYPNVLTIQTCLLSPMARTLRSSG